MSTFLLTWNPDKFHWVARRAVAIRVTAAGRPYKGRWATGIRKTGITPGKDRVFLLRQGSEPKGIVASGLITSPVFQRPHWDPERPREIANYVKVTWDVVLKDDDLLPLGSLKSKIARKDWEPQGGGVVLEPQADATLEALWASHIGPGRLAKNGKGSARPRRIVKRSKPQGWQGDPIKRKAVEDYAQDLLETHYRKMKWKVNDTRQGNPFDAMATKGKHTRYLEAKGTETEGASVLVTSGEVEFARAHPGECVMGIVSGIRFQPDDTLDLSSGSLATHDWDPDSGVLKPTAFTWAPPPGP